MFSLLSVLFVQIGISTTAATWPKIVAYELVGLLLAWVWLAIATRFRYYRRIGLSGWECFPGWEFFLRSKIPAPPPEISRQAAYERRQHLDIFLNEFRQLAGVPTEFIEVPGELKIEPRRLEDASQFWHASRLRIQRRGDHYLLLERVTDALVCLHRVGELSSEDFPISIRLKRTALSRFREFPWRVVVVTVSPMLLKKLVQQLNIAKWLGIGIEFVKPASALRPGSKPGEAPSEPMAEPQGRCVAGSDGLQGIVGGSVTGAQNERFGVTCRHVLSSTCGSLYWPGPPVRPAANEFTLETPDVAFIRLGSSCFWDQNQSRLPAVSANQADIDLAAAREAKVQKTPAIGGISGVVLFSNVSGFKLGKHFYRGPHFQITPAFYRKFGLIWPLFDRFSSKGDSGAWVIETETGQWLGMVVGGFSWPNRMTVALSAEHICDSFSRNQRLATSIAAVNSSPIAPEAFQ